jgi:hypothetical protein
MSAPPTDRPAGFPEVGGRGLEELRQSFEAGPELQPSTSRNKVLEPGENRFGFALYSSPKKQIAEVPAALYVAPVKGGPAAGPYRARSESLAVKGPFQSKTVSQDPEATKVIYVAEVPFKKRGDYFVLGVARLDERLLATEPVAVNVVDDTKVPEVGESAPRIDTPTVESVGGDVESIDTRSPPSSMHDVNFADVRGERPVVIVFATPQLCRSRVCGPVVDVAEQLKARRGEDAAFIHMEIYRDNEIRAGCLEGGRPLSQCYRDQVLAWNLPNEPWAFTVDSSGRVAARLEGAFSEKELERALDAALRQ